MSTDTCTVSVIVAAYNAAAYISACLDSMLAQTLRDWEVIVVEDHGTDDTVDIVQSYVDRDSRFRLMRTLQNSGPSAREIPASQPHVENGSQFWTLMIAILPNGCIS